MAWSLLNEKNLFYLTCTRLEFSCWLENTGAAPPVAFSTQGNLKSWAEQIGDMKIIPFGRAGEALRVHGDLHFGWYYDQIWAAKGYRGYRNLMKMHARDGFDVRSEDLNGVDADHVVARTMLREMPDAWVAIFPVPAVSNRPFGRIERMLPKVTPGRSRIDLSPISAFKLFCGCIPRTQEELKLAMGDVRGQIRTDNANVAGFVDAMEDDIRPYLQ